MRERPERGYTRRGPCERPARCIVRLVLRLILPLVMWLPWQATPQSPLTGTWVGHLVNLPERPGAAAVDVTVEIGPVPTTADDCTGWKTTYRESGVVKQVKDYRLCRTAGPGDFVIDEGGGVRLPARWIGDVLVSTFKVGQTLLVTHTRVRGDTLEEEILTMDDRPASTDLVTLVPTGIQRLSLRRQ